MSALQDKYQSLLDMAGKDGLSVSEGEGFIKIEGSVSSAEQKQALWDEYNRLDPEYRSGDLVLDVTAPEGAAAGGGGTYTVQSGDTLSKIGTQHGVSWQKIYDANRDKLDNPDKIFPGQELTIPSA